MWGIYAGASIRSQLQYRLSFLLGTLGQLLATGIEIVAVWALFERFDRLGGWSFPEVALFYGVVHTGFALADMVSSGFDNAGELIRNGSLDRLLLRPRTTVLQLLGYRFQLRRLGRLIQGIFVLGWMAPQLEVVWGGREIGLLFAAIAGTASLFVGLFAWQATLSIWTVQSLEIVNCATYGGVYAGQYPLTIYAKWLRRFFTYAVPIACVTYFPLVALLGRSDPLGTPPWFGIVAPSAGPLFLSLSLLGWTLGVRHYKSTGS